MIKLVISDLDGTFMKQEAHKVADEHGFSQNFEIPVHNLRAVEKLFEDKIGFAIATGNSLPLAKRHISDIKDTYVATQNGAFIEYNGKLIKKHYIEEHLKNEIVNFLVTLDEGYVCFEDYQYEYHVDYIYEKNKRDQRVNHYPQEFVKICSLDEVLQTSLSKLKFAIENATKEQIEHVAEVLTNKFGHLVNVFIASAVDIDIVAKEVSKGAAIKEIASELNLDLNEIAYFGDGGNDVPAFEVLEYSFVMSHARDKVKAHAKYEVDSVAEGIEIILNSINKKQVI